MLDLVHLFFGVLDARRPDGKRRLGLGNRRRVDDLAHAVLAPRLLELQARVRRVRDDVPADRFGGVLREGHAVGVRDDLC